MAIKRDKKVIKLGKRKFSEDRRIMALAIIVAAIIGLFLVLRPNAYKISMNGEFIGAIKNKKVIEGAKDTVITQLRNQYGAEVQFEKEIEVERYRARKKDYIDPNYLIASMRKKMDILIGFKEIFVEGESIGIVASEEEVEVLKEELKKRYYGKREVEVEFGKGVEVKDVFAKESDLVSMEKLVQKCTVTTPKSITYTVQPGDTLSGIASKYNTTIESIVSANASSGFTSKTILQVGQMIKANINEPFLPLNIVAQRNKTEENKVKADEKSEAGQVADSGNKAQQ